MGILLSRKKSLIVVDCCSGSVEREVAEARIPLYMIDSAIHLLLLYGYA